MAIGPRYQLVIRMSSTPIIEAALQQLRPRGGEGSARIPKHTQNYIFSKMRYKSCFFLISSMFKTMQNCLYTHY